MTSPEKLRTTSSAPNDELTRLICLLDETQQRIAQITGGEIDSIVVPSGMPNLLPHAQEKLRRSEADQRNFAGTLASILDAIPATVALLDADGNVVTVNRAWRAFASETGYVAGCGIGQNYVAVSEAAAGDAYARRAAAGIRDILQGKSTSFSLEYPCHTPEQQRWFSLVAAPLNASEPGGAVVMHIDISSRKAAENDLAALQRRTELILASIAEGIHVVGPDGRSVYANPAAVEMVGYTSEEMRRHTTHELIHHHKPDGSLYPWDECPLRETLRDGKTVRFEQDVFFRADGTAFPVEYTSSPIVDEAGNITGGVVSFRDITERKIAEQALRESEAQQRRLVAELDAERARLVAAQLVAKVGSWEIDLTSSETTWSLENYRIYDVDPTSFVPTARSFFELAHPGDRRAVESAFKQSIDTRERSTFEHRLFAADGTIKCIVLRWETFVDEKGRPLRAIGVSIDVTEARAASRELERSRTMLKMASRLSGVGAWSIELPSNMLSWSDELRAIRRAPPDFVPTIERALSFHTPEYRPIFVAALEACARDGTPFDLHVQLRPFDGGDVVWARIVGEAVRDEHGHIVRVQGAHQDVDDRKRLSAKLAESEERFRYVAQATTDAIWDWNLLTDQVWWNSGLTTLFGYDPGEIEPDARSWRDRIHPDDCEKVLASAERLLPSSDVTWDHRFRFRRKDGAYAHVDVSATVVRDENGRVIRAIGAMTDVTKSLELEEQLQRAQRLESLGQLTGGVAHDFNNLLTVIMGNAGLLSESLQHDEELCRMARLIGDAAQRGGELTQRLLAFGRLQVLEPTAVDVNGLVGRMMELLSRSLGEHVEITADYGDDLSPANVDAAQLEGALLNLCLNARDAMPAGGKLTIETARARLDETYGDEHLDVTPGAYVLLAISDTGSGISSADLPRVFDPFFTTKLTGTGLGLSMVYGFVKQSGGHVSIYSEPGHGTTVKLYLPQLTGAAAAIPDVPTESVESTGTETILLVEDDELVRGYVVEQLTSLGYRVIEACNGNEALTALDVHDDVDLLFTDIVMPGGMNGIELGRAALERRPTLRVLYTSGYTEGAVVNSGAGFGGLLLSKPYHRAELSSKVRFALSSEPRVLT